MSAAAMNQAIAAAESLIAGQRREGEPKQEPTVEFEDRDTLAYMFEVRSAAAALEGAAALVEQHAGTVILRFELPDGNIKLTSVAPGIWRRGEQRLTPVVKALDEKYEEKDDWPTEQLAEAAEEVDGSATLTKGRVVLSKLP